jgi:methylenetetrahydrofolate dehydrogenase (NADP+)/methenyltetrahydrofolate cyclohydrolase
VAARILDGKTLALAIRSDVAAGVERLKADTGVVPGLTVVLVGDDPASALYVRNKQNACKAAGMNGHIERLPADTPQATLTATIDLLNDDPSVHGILVQFPLPKSLDDRAIVERVDPRKDVDGFHPLNAGLLAMGTPRFVPCTPQGIRALLEASRIETRGADAVVLGRSQIVGKPMALLLLQKGPGGDATVTVCHTATRDAAVITRRADIVIAAVGRPEQVRGDWIKPGAAVIDVGIHKRDDGSLCGDVHAPSVAEVAGALSPVPGGVGPLTVAMLLRNTLQAATALALRHGEPSR